MPNPLLSVCIITYNHESYIRQAIDSVLMQKTNFLWELIIADDFSKDNTRAILLEYQNKYPHLIKLILQESNVGAVKNWIDLITSPKSKYIAYFEGDDYWISDYKLQKQVDFLEKNAAYSACFHYTQELNEEGKLGFIHGKHGRKLNFSTKDTFTTTSLFHTSSFLFRTNTFKLPEWYGEIYGTDLTMFSVISSHGKFRCIPEIMSIYRQHSYSITKGSYATQQVHHANRIKLMHYLDEYHGYKYHKQAMKVIKFHKDGLKGIYRYTPYEKFKNKIKKIIRAIK